MLSFLEGIEGKEETVYLSLDRLVAVATAHLSIKPNLFKKEERDNLFVSQLTKEEFTKVEYPKYLEIDIINGKLHTYSNREMIYKIKEEHARIFVIWNYLAPEVTNDILFDTMRETKSNLIIKQGKNESFKAILSIQPKIKSPFDDVLKSTINTEVQALSQGTTSEKFTNRLWKTHISDEFKLVHEAHFTQVTANYLEAEKLPEWETPNMSAKYYTTIASYRMAKQE